jgi:hypothetical protein
VGRTYYIALTAIDYSLNESGYSQELSVRIDSSATTTTIDASATTTIPPSDAASVIEAEDMSYHANGSVSGDYWNLWSNGTMKGEVYFPTSGTHQFEIIAKSSLADSIGSEMKLLIDGETRGSVFVNSTTPQTYVFNVDVSEGSHEIAIGFYNDYYDAAAGIDRNLLVDKVVITFAAGGSVSTVIVEAEDMNCSFGRQSGDYWNLWSNGIMYQDVYFPANGTYRFEIIAKATLANNVGADMRMLIDGRTMGSVFVNSTTPETYVFNVEVSEGTHEIAIGFYNDYYEPGEFAAIDRNLLVDKTIITTDAEITTTTITVRPSTTSIPADVNPPVGTITINDGSETTNSRSVTLSFSIQDLISGMGEGAQMMLSNDNQNWFGPKPFSQTTAWVLTSGGGLKTVYGKFCDAEGNWMEEPVSASIVFQLSCPEAVKLEPASTDCSGKYLTMWSDDKAVDGKPITGWLSPLRRSMQEEFITLDLGGVKVINRIDIHSRRFIGRDLFPCDFKVQVSTDNQNWTDVVTEQDYTLPASRSASWSFDGTEAGYIKLVATKPQKFLVFYYLTYISEIEVFGCAEPEVPETEGLAATQSAGESRSLLSKEAFDREVAAKKGPVIGDAVPGRPGKPLFILKENE